jgi:hypothetical protein
VTEAVGIVGRGRVGTDLLGLLGDHDVPGVAVDLTEGLGPVLDLPLVVEAITEELSTKRGVVADLLRARADRVVLTTTSSFTAAEVATSGDGAAASPRVAAWHPFRPMRRRRLVEVACHADTADDVRAAALTLAHRLDLTAIPVADRTGFVVNRILKRWTHAAVDSAAGRRPEAVDAVLLDAGFPMGPFAVIALVGPDTSLRIARRFETVHGARFRAPALLSGEAAAPATHPVDDVLGAVRSATVDEMTRVLADGCAPDDLATALRLGAGWPESVVTAWLADAMRA